MSASDERRAAREIFAHALNAVDASAAVRRSASASGSRLSICGEHFDVSARGVYVIAIGKAAQAMALGLAKTIEPQLTKVVVSGPQLVPTFILDPKVWTIFEGGHPIPNEQSLASADAAFDLLRKADDERALVVFLVSGGGSAMMEKLKSANITLADLQETNRLLVSCGASIAEINSIRAALSEVKAGGLARRAPNCEQVTLIVSDTNEGDERTVASGPTFDEGSSSNALDVISRYSLDSKLPAVVTSAIREFAVHEKAANSNTTSKKRHHVLLTNRNALEAAAEKAQQLGFITQINFNICEQPIEDGCELLVQEATKLFEDNGKQPACLISGGEFSCPVNGDGVGGRNSETALRSAMEVNRLGLDKDRHMVLVSAGTDGVDGNSPAAGAIADETTIKRALKGELNPGEFLARSDAFSFFNVLGDALITGPTGTNVRDVRIVLILPQGTGS